MTTLHLMVGLPCAGKTTLARRLEVERPALRLTPDEWHLCLFGQDVEEPEHDARHNLIEALLWDVAARALALGTNVILDFGFWSRAEREDFRARAHHLGAGSEVHFLDVPEAELLRRVAVRNAQAAPGAYRIPIERMHTWIALFQAPDPDELVRREWRADYEGHSAMRLHVEPYVSQSERLPRSGRHILAQFDDDAIVVYQAFRPAIGLWAAEHGRFGGEFSFSRMSWIKTSFLWMMYRSGWASKPGQEVILAVWLQRAGFEAILAEAVPATYDPTLYRDKAERETAVARSTVRLQWDPDRTPGGGRLGRRAIQLGLRGRTLARYATEWILGIEDITDFVREQAELARSPAGHSNLLVPHAEIYRPANAETTARIGLSSS